MLLRKPLVHPSASAVAVLIAFCLSVQSTIFAADDVRSLKINVLAGDGSFNDIKKGKAQNVEVQILDQSDRPVSGASVIFKLPPSGSAGPGGTFGKGELNFTAMTGTDGRASSSGLRPNSREGRYNIQVQASYQGIQTQTVVSQSNTTATAQTGAGSHKVLWLVLLGVGGAAGAAIAISKRGSSTSTPAPTATTLSVGSITVGGPQ